MYICMVVRKSKMAGGFTPGVVNCKKGCTWLAAASDEVYQLLAHCQWFSPGTPASSTTKTGRHDIAEMVIQLPNSLSHPGPDILLSSCYIGWLICMYRWLTYTALRHVLCFTNCCCIRVLFFTTELSDFDNWHHSSASLTMRTIACLRLILSDLSIKQFGR
jgi:hypothetical protein